MADLFYNGEVDGELRRVELLQYRFKLDSDREECMQVIEMKRKESVYIFPHYCRDNKVNMLQWNLRKEDDLGAEVLSYGSEVVAISEVHLFIAFYYAYTITDDDCE